MMTTVFLAEAEKTPLSLSLSLSLWGRIEFDIVVVVCRAQSVVKEGDACVLSDKVLLVVAREGF